MPESPLNIEALVSAGAISGIDVSPDGASVVFSSSAGGRPRLYVRDIGTDGITRRLDTGTESATQPKWSPRGDVIAFLQDVGGDENYRICVVDPAGGEVRDLTRAPGKLHENYSWSADGTRLAFVSNRDGQFDVYYVDVDTAEVKRVTNHLSVHHSPEFSRVGDAISYCSNRTDLRGNWDTFVTTFSDGRERQITRHKGEADEMSYYAGQRPHWAPGDGRVLVSSSVRGTYDITSIDPRTLKQTWLIEGPLEETNAQWAPDGSRLAYIVNQDGNQVIHIMRPDTGEAWPVSQLSGSSGVIGMRGKGADYRWTADGESIVYGHHSATEPGSVWAVAAGGGEPRLLYSSMPEGLDRSALVQPSVVSYESFDGRSISGLLFRPLSASVGPGIIMPHGGPTGQSTNAWGPLIQYMVSLGYVVFEPNFRGSTGRGREFQWLNRNDWGGGDLRDVVAAADWLESQGIASGMGIMGGSYGGYMTLSGVTQYPDRWLAAVSIFGIANLVTMYRTAREDMRHFQARNIGTPDENPAFYRERSPLNHVERITAPLLILQGERDARVPRLEAEQMRDGLHAAGKEFEYVVYGDEGHGFTKLDTKLDYIARIGRFFQKHMPVG